MTRQEILNFVKSFSSWMQKKERKEIKLGLFKVYGFKKNKTPKLRLVK